MLIKLNPQKSIASFLKTVKYDFIRIGLFSLLIGFIAQGKYFLSLQIPLALVGIVGTAISLLLTFRTAQSYDRWWEARIIWGAIVNDSRTLIRQLMLFLPKSHHHEVVAFANRQALWCFALSESLRKIPHSERVQRYIDEHHITDANIPNAILALHSKQLKEFSEKGLISEFREVQIDSTLLKLCESMGKCERIKSTVFPANYGELIHMLIYFFALILPFALNDEFLFVKTILTALIPLIFIVIERTAIFMQDPFENAPMDTPMTTISTTIEKNLMEMVGEKAPDPITPKEDFYFIL